MTKLGEYVLLAVMVGIIINMFFLVKKSLDVPIVRMSTATNQCVEILDRGKTYKCVKLDGMTYAVEWVR